MDKLMREFGKSLQKELITKLIAASQDAFDKDTFFTEDNLTAIFDSSCSEMKKSTKKAAKKSKKKKDPSQPSRTNTWMVYSNEQRPLVKAANPKAKFQDIGKMISKQWKALSEDEKQVYKDRANEINESNGFTVVSAPKKKTPKKKAPSAPKKKKAPSAPKKKKTQDPDVQNVGSDLDDLVDELDDLVEEYD
jgi:hypothetical protein